MRRIAWSTRSADPMRRGLSALLVLIFLVGIGDGVASYLCPPPGAEAEAHHLLDGPSNPGADEHSHHHHASGHDHGSSADHSSGSPDPTSHHDGHCPFGGGSMLTCGAAASIHLDRVVSTVLQGTEHRLTVPAPPVLLDSIPGEGPFRPPRS